MNERIEELIAKATIVEHGADNGFDRVTFDKEKFAEMIVLECFKATMIESKGHTNPIDLMKRVKERLGVEE